MALESCLVLGRGHMHLVPVMIELVFSQSVFWDRRFDLPAAG